MTSSGGASGTSARAATGASRSPSTGFQGWVAPDSGGDTQTHSFGGERADHDVRYIEQALEFLRERADGARERPFCLVVSLVNPHDVLGFPRDWEDHYVPADLEGPVELPPTSRRIW